MASECSVCLEDDVLIPTGCGKGHAFCQPCQRLAYGVSMASHRVPLHCLACSNEVSEAAVRAVLPRSEYERFLELSLLATLQRERALFCPHPDCTFVAHYEPASSSCADVVCLHCNRRVCLKCRQPWHSGRCQNQSSMSGVKPCPSCGSHIFKEQDGSCNHMTCSVCRTEFCWLCGKILDPWNVLGHFTSLSGCTFFGSARWSKSKVNAWRLTTPVTVPLAIAGGAVAVAALSVTLPWFAASGEWKHARASSLPVRALKAGGAGLGTLAVAPSIAATTLACLSARGLVYAFVQMPIEQSVRLAKHIKRRAGRRSRSRRDAAEDAEASPAESVA